MKKAGLWSDHVPLWVQSYEPENIPDVWQWMQFIYLPMRANGMIYKSQYLAPLLSSHVNSDPTRQNILQLVIELDSISPTIDKKNIYGN